MKRMVVDLLEKFAIGLFVLFLLAGLIGGYGPGGVVGAIVGLIVAFLMAVLVFGIIFVQLEMNESLRAIRQQLESRRP
ncbi:MULTISPECIES: hypothetical protein [unclassified Elioraea]|jgi:uncharacterized membrane protein YhdT|uniref:hypothetical protein n=1 Tax=unclassified Elioraea TaxID=2619524 RepID=UPI00114DD3AD|nr:MULTISPECIES: hypothetical protein [unclassified Elioraea]TQF76457.1 hypothetical protein FK498_17690 [Elioraea sp. Yellowstone]GIX08720.1 MAG: hypothetical protein KatS3mg116_0430 [Elioraea sp.]